MQRLPASYRDLAILRRVIVAGADLPVADRRALLDALPHPARPYRPLALEQLALLLVEAGETDGGDHCARALRQDQERTSPACAARRADDCGAWRRTPAAAMMQAGLSGGARQEMRCETGLAGLACGLVAGLAGRLRREGSDPAGRALRRDVPRWTTASRRTAEPRRAPPVQQNRSGADQPAGTGVACGMDASRQQPAPSGPAFGHLAPVPCRIWTRQHRRGQLAPLPHRRRRRSSPGGRIFTIDARADRDRHLDRRRHALAASLVPATDRGGEASGGGLAYGEGKLFVTTGFGELLALDPAIGRGDLAPAACARRSRAPRRWRTASSMSWRATVRPGRSMPRMARVRWQLTGVAVDGRLSSAAPARR